MKLDRIAILLATLTVATALTAPASAQTTGPLLVNPDPDTPQTGPLLSLLDHYVWMWNSVTRTLAPTPAVAGFGSVESCSSGDVNAEGGCEQSDGCEWNDDAPLGKTWWTQGSGYTEADLKFGLCVGARIFTPTGASGYFADYRGAFRAADLPLGTYKPEARVWWLGGEDGGPLPTDGARNGLALPDAPICVLRQAASRTVGSCVYSPAGDEVLVPSNYVALASVTGFRITTQWMELQPDGTWTHPETLPQPLNLDCPDCLPGVGPAR